MTVNIKLQCLATLTLPTGLYAFKRVGKLKQGVIFYSINYFVSFILGGMLVATATQENMYVDILTLVSLIVGVAGIIIPMRLIKQYSVIYNNNLKSKSAILS